MRWIWTKKRRDEAAKEAEDVLRSQREDAVQPGGSHEREEQSPGHFQTPGDVDFINVRVTPAGRP